MDFAKRAYDHSYHIDPVVRSLLDDDFYKLLMLQVIWEKHRFDAVVTFAVTNRTKSVKLAEEIDINELRAQLEHVRTLRFKKRDILWLRAQTFYGQQGVFKKAFLDWLATLQLPEFHLDYEVDEAGNRTGQFDLSFTGSWPEVTLWEIHSMEIINELRYRAIMKAMTPSQLDIMYARAKVKLHDKLNLLAGSDLDGISITDFGTRRRHSHLWQEYCIQTAMGVLGERFTGTSNAFFAEKYGLEARGTNAHELPMVLAALADSDDYVRQAQYRVLQQWQNVYNIDALKVMLPDTFGTTQFLRDAPEWVRLWTGARPDSKDPIEGGEELIEFWNRTDPLHAAEKLIIFSDGMDVRIPGFEPQGSDIPTVFRHFRGRVRMGFGWGTMLTNDFIGCHPGDPMAMKPISLVCKVKSVNGRPAVKLSDNYTKATGPAAEVERYRRIFGTDGVKDAPCLV